LGLSQDRRAPRRAPRAALSDPATRAHPPAPPASQAAALDGALARKLSLDAVLHGHAGCVNRLAWSEAGDLLASASDDLRVGP
jgi:WD40 repeat protein